MSTYQYIHSAPLFIFRVTDIEYDAHSVPITILARSSSGLGRHPFKVEITGSNPVRATTSHIENALGKPEEKYDLTPLYSKIFSERNADTITFGMLTMLLILRSTATLQII